PSRAARRVSRRTGRPGGAPRRVSPAARAPRAPPRPRRSARASRRASAPARSSARPPSPGPAAEGTPPPPRSSRGRAAAARGCVSRRAPSELVLAERLQQPIDPPVTGQLRGRVGGQPRALHEVALVGARVRQRELRIVLHEIPEHDEVEVERAIPPPLG